MNDNKRSKVDRVMQNAKLIEEQANKAVRPFREDGYVNLVNRYGTEKDMTERYKFVAEPAVPDDLLTMFYEGNGLFAKIIDAPAEEAVKHGFKLKGISDPELEDFYVQALDELDWEETATTCIKWARLFGGSLAVMLINDGGKLEEPLRWDRIKSIDDIRVYDRSVIQPDYTSMFSYDPRDPFRTRGSRLGMPEYYNIFSKYGSFTVHDSRVLTFRNGVLPENTTNSVYELWGMSEYVRIKRAIRDAELAHASGPKMLDRSVQPVYKMKDLAMELQTEEGESQVLKRLQAIDMARGIMNSLVIDSEGEDYDFKQFQYTGVADVVDSACNFLSALTNIPQTVLFGRSPAGMNATGQSDLENWYSYVARIQKRNLRGNLRYLLSVIFQAGLYTKEVKEVPDINIEFNPLWSLSDLQQADLELKREQVKKTRAETAQIYIDMQAIDPSEVRNNLAKEDEFDIENVLDDIPEEELMDIFEQEEPADVPPEFGGEEKASGSTPNFITKDRLKEHAEKIDIRSKSEGDPDAGNAPDAAPEATKLPQDMDDQAPANGRKATKQDSSSNSTEEKNYGSVGILVVSDGKVLSGTRHNDFGYGLICGPGGHVEAGETAEQAAIRETQEEFGITPKNLIPLGKGPVEQDTKLTPDLFLCLEWEGEPSCDDLEMVNPQFRTLEELEQLKPSMFQPFADGLAVLFEELSEIREDGGAGSGNWGHGGRPGKRGGSTGGGGISNRQGSKEGGFTSEAKHRAESKKRGIAEGRDISGTFAGDPATKNVLKKQGFTGKPKIVGQKEFDEAVAASGFIAQRTYTASSQEVLDAYQNELYHGDFYVDCTVGGAQYGQGMYCAADYSGNLSDGIKSEMAHYKELGQKRAIHDSLPEFANSLTTEDFESNTYSKGLSLSDQELSVYKKLKSDPNMTGYKLPEDERAVWQEMIKNGKWGKANLAFSDMQDEFIKNFEAPCITETLTLVPDAKIIKHSDLNQLKQNAGKKYLREELERYAVENGPEVAALYKIQTGGGATNADFQTVIKWQAEHPEAYQKAEQHRIDANKKASEIMVKAMSTDDGAYAAMLGYDAIDANGHGESGSYTVILNRTKVIFLDGSKRSDALVDAIYFEEGKNGIVYAMRNGKIIGWVMASDSTSKKATNEDGRPNCGDINPEKPLDFSADGVTIKSTDNTDGAPHGNKNAAGPHQGKGKQGHKLSAQERKKIGDRLIGQKSSKGTVVTGVSTHAFDRLGGRSMSVGRVEKMLASSDTKSDKNHPDRTLYDIPGSRLVLADDGEIVSVMWRKK